jgi:DnaJ domain
MLRTHYDSLKIARDAPIEVVRAAYRVLSIKHHPDRNPGDPEAAHTMAVLNAAYAVLSDPEKRREHDEWIRHLETGSLGPESRLSGGYAHVASASTNPDRPAWRDAPYWRNYAVWSAVAVLAIVGGIAGSAYYQAKVALRPFVPLPEVPREAPVQSAGSADPPPRSILSFPSTSSKPPQAAPSPLPDAAAEKSESAAALHVPAEPPPAVPERKPAAEHKPAPVAEAKPHESPAGAEVPRSVESSAPADGTGRDQGEPRAGMAPNGAHWPRRSDYVAGYEVLYTNGSSQLVLDNSGNGFDVFLKVVSLGDPEPRTVRSIFIQAHDRFTVDNMRNGTYEVRYRALDSGTLMRSATFALEESAIASGSRHSIVTLALPDSEHDDPQTFPVSEEEFEQ